MMKQKKCSKCKETKGIEDFHKKKGTIDGRHCYCKTCAIGITVAANSRRDAARKLFNDMFF